MHLLLLHKYPYIIAAYARMQHMLKLHGTHATFILYCTPNPKHIFNFVKTHTCIVVYTFTPFSYHKHGLYNETLNNLLYFRYIVLCAPKLRARISRVPAIYVRTKIRKTPHFFHLKIASFYSRKKAEYCI